MAASANTEGHDKAVPPPSSTADGQRDKVLATAHHIVRSLATNQSSADDMLRILSGFDHRFTNLLPSPSDKQEQEEEEEEEEDEEEEEEDGFFSDLELRISRWDDPSSLLFESSAADRSDYLSAVDAAISLGGPKADALVHVAMARLEDEFRHLLIRNTAPLDSATAIHSSLRRNSLSLESNEDVDTGSSSESDPSSRHQRHESAIDERTSRLSISDEQREIDLVHPDAVDELREIADRMIAAEYHRELCQVYSSIRRDTLDECLSVLGIYRMSIEEVQKIEWRSLDDKMRKWTQAVRIVVRVLLSGERRLCETIFALSDELVRECFVESSKGCVMHLLNFGDAIAIGRRSSEKLFRILDMYDALSEVMPELKDLFLSDYVVVEAEDIMVRLGEAVMGTINEFGNAVQNETSRKVLPSGEIHPLTRYVMNYVKLLVEYSSSLESLLDDTDFAGDDGADCGESRTPLGCRLRLLISYLESNLEEKAKLYEDAALQFIFLMNNMLYIIQKVRGSDLGKFLGENWVRKRRGQIRQYHNHYLRASWTRALSFLKDDGMSGVWSLSVGGVSKVNVKDRFKSFNLAFEEIYKTQTMWKVSDPQLREELKLSMSENIIPAYRSFLGRYGSHLDTVRNAGKYIKYTPEDLESHLSELFEGTTGMSNNLRRKLSS